MYSEFPLGEEIFLLPGPAGDLEVLTTSPAEAKAVAIICHPHPLFSGTMHNKVVSTLAKTCQELGLRTVRFNFRGVGKSTGTFAEGVGEADDLFAIIQWVQHVCPAEKIWLAGFSFGAAVSIYAATKIHVEKLISIAPPVSRFPLIKNAVLTNLNELQTWQRERNIKSTDVVLKAYTAAELDPLTYTSYITGRRNLRLRDYAAVAKIQASKADTKADIEYIVYPPPGCRSEFDAPIFETHDKKTGKREICIQDLPDKISDRRLFIEFLTNNYKQLEDNYGEKIDATELPRLVSELPANLTKESLTKFFDLKKIQIPYSQTFRKYSTIIDDYMAFKKNNQCETNPPELNGFPHKYIHETAKSFLTIIIDHKIPYRVDAETLHPQLLFELRLFLAFSPQKDQFKHLVSIHNPKNIPLPNPPHIATGDIDIILGRYSIEALTIPQKILGTAQKLANYSLDKDVAAQEDPLLQYKSHKYR